MDGPGAGWDQLSSAGTVPGVVPDVVSGDDDPGAIALMRKLAQKSRERWPGWAEPVVRLGLPEKKPKKAAATAAAAVAPAG